MDKQKEIDATIQDDNRRATARELWNAWRNLLTLNMMIETEIAD
jgi:hypothetical protein